MIICEDNEMIGTKLEELLCQKSAGVPRNVANFIRLIRPMLSRRYPAFRPRVCCVLYWRLQLENF